MDEKDEWIYVFWAGFAINMKYETKAWGDGDGDGMREQERLGFLCLWRGYLNMYNTDEYMNVCIQKSFTCIGWKAKPQPLKSFMPSVALLHIVSTLFSMFYVSFAGKLSTCVSKAEADRWAFQVCLLVFFTAIIGLWIIIVHV